MTQPPPWYDGSATPGGPPAATPYQAAPGPSWDAPAAWNAAPAPTGWDAPPPAQQPWNAAPAPQQWDATPGWGAPPGQAVVPAGPHPGWAPAPTGYGPAQYGAGAYGAGQYGQYGYAAPGYGPGSPAYGGYASEAERNSARWSHFGPLAFGIWVPLIILLTKGKESPVARAHAAESLNFHLCWAAYMIIGIVLTACTAGILFPVPLAAVVAMYVLSIVGGVRAGRGELFRYPMTIRMVT